MNGNNLLQDNNFVMEWTFLLTMCPTVFGPSWKGLSILIEIYCHSGGWAPLEALKALQGLKPDGPSGAQNKSQGPRLSLTV